MPKLLWMTQDGTVRQFALQAPITSIGRARTNDLAIASETLSRRHALLALNGAAVTVKDLGSVNGTYVNGEKIVFSILVDGDGLKVGNCAMRFLQDDRNLEDAEALRLLIASGPVAAGLW
jgi:pSer/pThr/pTyr-binding forkhead associated (FHA) protein